MKNRAGQSGSAIRLERLPADDLFLGGILELEACKAAQKLPRQCCSKCVDKPINKTEEAYHRASHPTLV